MKKKQIIEINRALNMRYLILPLFLFFIFGCKQKNTVEAEVREIPVEVDIQRFDKDFAQTEAADLAVIKKKYPAFFPEQFDDAFWIEKMSDTLQIELEQETLKVFPDDEKLVGVLKPLFQHIQYYFPEFSVPIVITVTSDVDYQEKVIVSDSLLIIELDTYLGENHEFYRGIERYFVKNMKPSQIAPDVAKMYARSFIKRPRKNNLLDLMIYYGKELYLKDLWLPNSSDAEKIGYTEEEYAWAEENEIYMWQFFIENELLYSSDARLPARFLNPAPFSKFYLEIDNESPGMLGRYLGWKIVRAYMKNNDIDVRELMMLDADELFKKSKYKPKK